MKNKLVWALILWCLIFLAITIKWIITDKTPRPWDQASYLEASEIIYHSFQKSPQEFFSSLTTILPRRPPLISYIPLPLYLIFGSSTLTALFTNIIFLTLFYIFFYLLLKQYFNEELAIGAIIFTSTMPLFYGLSRQFLAEFGLMTLVIIWIYYLFKTDNLTSNKFLLVLGFVGGLGLLIKITFPIYIIGFLFLLAFKFLKSHSFIKLSKKIFLISFPALILTLPWYSQNILTALWHAKRSADPTVLQNFYYGNPFSPEVVYLALLDWINYVISGWYFIALVFGLIVVLLKKILKVNKEFVIWVVLPFTLSLFSPNKDYRLILPLVPLFGFLLAYIFQKIFRPALPYYLILAIYPIIFFINTSLLPIPLLQSRISLGDILISDQTFGSYTKLPNKLNWPLEEILRFIADLPPGSSVKTISILSEDEIININSTMYFIEKDQLPLKIVSLSFTGISQNEFDKRTRQVDYFIARSNFGQNSTFVNLDELTVIDNDFIFPDETKLLIFKADNSIGGI